MPIFSDFSMQHLSTCHPHLQTLFLAVIIDFDCRVVYGHRGEAEQNLACDMGYSQCRWPNSKHNKTPSLAADVVPYPVDWKDRERMCLLAGWTLRIAKDMGITIRWGGDWDQDMCVKDESFSDLAHYELLL